MAAPAKRRKIDTREGGRRSRRIRPTIRGTTTVPLVRPRTLPRVVEIDTSREAALDNSGGVTFSRIFRARC